MFIQFWGLFEQVFLRGHVCRNSFVLIAYTFEERYLVSLILFNCTLWKSVPDGSLQWSSSCLVCMYVCIYLFLFIYLFICVWMNATDVMCVCLFVGRSVRPYVCMYVCTYVCTYVHMSVCLYVCMSVCLYACMPVCLYVCMPVCLYVCLPVCLYVCMY